MEQISQELNDAIAKFDEADRNNNEDEMERWYDKIVDLRSRVEQIDNPQIQSIVTSQPYQEVKTTIEQYKGSTVQPIDLIEKFRNHLDPNAKKAIGQEIINNVNKELKPYFDEIDNYKNATGATAKLPIALNFFKQYPQFINKLNTLKPVRIQEILNYKPFETLVETTTITIAAYNSKKNGETIAITHSAAFDQDFPDETIAEFNDPTAPDINGKIYAVVLALLYHVNKNNYSKAEFLGIQDAQNLGWSDADFPPIPAGAGKNASVNGTRKSYYFIYPNDFMDRIILPIQKMIQDNLQQWVDEYVNGPAPGVQEGGAPKYNKTAMRAGVGLAKRLQPIVQTIATQPPTAPIPPPATPGTASGISKYQKEDRMKKLVQAILLYHISMITQADEEMIKILKSYGCDDNFITSILLAPNKYIVSQLAWQYKPNMAPVIISTIIQYRRQSEIIKFQRNWNMYNQSMNTGINANNNLFWNFVNPSVFSQQAI